MGDITARGGVHDPQSGWDSLLEAVGVPFERTRVYSSGANTYVVVDERWVIYPISATEWTTRKWRGWRDTEALNALDADAPDSWLTWTFAPLQRHKRLWRGSALVVAAVTLAWKVYHQARHFSFFHHL